MLLETYYEESDELALQIANYIIQHPYSVKSGVKVYDGKYPINNFVRNFLEQHKEFPYRSKMLNNLGRYFLYVQLLSPNQLKAESADAYQYKEGNKIVIVIPYKFIKRNSENEISQKALLRKKVRKCVKHELIHMLDSLRDRKWNQKQVSTKSIKAFNAQIEKGKSVKEAYNHSSVRSADKNYIEDNYEFDRYIMNFLNWAKNTQREIRTVNELFMIIFGDSNHREFANSVRFKNKVFNRLRKEGFPGIKYKASLREGIMPYFNY